MPFSLAPKLTLIAILFSLFCAGASTAWASENMTSLTYPSNHTLTAQVGIQNVHLGLDLQGPTSPISYRPNAPERNYLALNYDHVGLSAAFANQMAKDKEEMYGTSVVSDYHLLFYGVRHTIGAFYQDYSGYYMTNSELINPNIKAEQPRFQRSDLNSRSLGVEYYYTFSPEDFSLEAAYGHGTRPTQSGSSWIGTLTTMDTRITADRPLVPNQLAKDFGSISTITGGRFQSFNAGIGYGGTAMFGSWYLTGILGYAYGPQHQSFEMDGKSYDRWVPNSAANVKIGMGYNGKRFFSGLQTEALGTNITINSTTMTTNQTQTLVFIGLRTFDWPISFLEPISNALSLN